MKDTIKKCKELSDNELLKIQEEYDDIIAKISNDIIKNGKTYSPAKLQEYERRLEKANKSKEAVRREVASRFKVTKKQIHNLRKSKRHKPVLFNKFNKILNKCIYNEDTITSFISIINDNLPRLILLSSIDSNAVPTLLVLAFSIIDSNNGLEVEINQRLLASILNRSPRTIRRTINILVNNKFLRRNGKHSYSLNAKIISSNFKLDQLNKNEDNKFYLPEFDEYFYDENNEKVLYKRTQELLTLKLFQKDIEEFDKDVDNTTDNCYNNSCSVSSNKSEEVDEFDWLNDDNWASSSIY